MYARLKNSYIFTNRKNDWNQPNIPITVLLVILLISGCVSKSSRQDYENLEVGIKLEMPRNWDVTYYERSGTIIVQPKNSIGNNFSARIEIQGNACSPTPTWFQGPREEIEANIDRIRVLYELESITIIQEPTKINGGENEVIKATIVIPTMSLLEDDARNQIGEQNPDLFQTIEIFAIRNKNHFIMSYVYEGNSDELNIEAEEIVASIQLTCSE